MRERATQEVPAEEQSVAKRRPEGTKKFDALRDGAREEVGSQKGVDLGRSVVEGQLPEEEGIEGWMRRKELTIEGGTIN